MLAGARVVAVGDGRGMESRERRLKRKTKGKRDNND